MKNLIILVSYLLLITPFSTAFATEPPYLRMSTLNLWSGIKSQNLFDQLVSSNPLYVFSSPFRDTAVLTPTNIQSIHASLPQTKVVLHLLCCTLFDNQTIESIPIKVHAGLQNTQQEFTAMWSNHRNAFMKNSSGDYVYYHIARVGEYWTDPGDGYLMDPANPHYQELLYNKIKQYIVTGEYDGVYLDLMYPTFMQAFYFSKPIVNGNPITRDQWNSKLISLSQYLQNRRKNDPNSRMKNAIIFTNSVGGGPGDSNDPVDRVQFNRDLQTQGVQIENPFQDYRTLTANSWLAQVNRIRDISALNNKQLSGWINYHGAELFPSQEECDQHGLFAYASYLLANQSPNFAFSFGCRLAAGVNNAPSQNLTHLRLGSPLAPYQLLNSGLYIREFTNGFSLVNIASSALNYKPNTNLQNAYSSTTYPPNTNITLPAKTGLVLLKNAPSSLPGDFNLDGSVNLLDYNLLKADFGTTYNLLDYNTLRSHWGR